MHLESYFSTEHYGITHQQSWEPAQLGANIIFPQRDGWEKLADCDIILLSTNEYRGAGQQHVSGDAMDKVRHAFYKMYYWHPSVRIADLGNLINGASLSDTHFALKDVLNYIVFEIKKKAVILGGSHDLTLEQYGVFKQRENIVDCVIIDKSIDLQAENATADQSFLFELLTTTPNYIKNFTAMAFQSYYANPNIIETLDKLNFDCHRLGKVRDELNEMEPAIRSSAIISIDMQVMKQSDVPGIQGLSPNGLMGHEICSLTRFAGMSEDGRTMGIYGIGDLENNGALTADLIAQMLWYFVDGHFLKTLETDFSNTDMYKTYNVNADGHLLKFITNRRTNRWWMQLKEDQFVPCAEFDYREAAQGFLPDRWLRAIGKLDY